MNRRARSSNFTQECTINLVNIVNKYSHIIENKRTDSVMWQEKKNAWIRITNEFNYMAIERRTPEQLKQKYETLKKEARREAANMLVKPVETEVALPSKEKSNPLYARIRQMMELSTEEFPTMKFTESMDALDTRVQQPQGGSITHTEEEDDNYEIEVIGPSVIMDNGSEAAIPSGSSASTVYDGGSDSNPTQHTMPERPLTAEVNEYETGSDNFKKRKRPDLGISSHKHFFKCQNLRSWIGAKEELLSLKKELLLKEFKEREKREIELHVVNMSIKQAQLKNEQLENQLKMEKLRKLVRENQEFEMDTQWK
ncbi:uncharacterized protein LOC124158729 [Ischnura elegans]|uniref:uncharacterized protein LOC124158729 n=1 Tax=Ischnura elegans TaxID=197161 RepID=UPI001ED89012|nr:uncharacterized protein LOC124158729 [Ischnura elegans]